MFRLVVSAEEKGVEVALGKFLEASEFLELVSGLTRSMP